MTLQPWHVRVYVGVLLAAALAMRLTGFELPLWVRAILAVVVAWGVARLFTLAWRHRQGRWP